jgi:hypothetical protein
MRRAFGPLAVLLTMLGFLAGCGSEDRKLARGRQELKLPRQWSGISYADRTVVERAPSRTASGSGFDAERAWSGEDDWEPYVAVDAERGFVYQFATRWVTSKYKIVVRRSLDGGATWEPDQLMFPSTARQADPYAKVGRDGTVYAIWMEVWDTVLSKSTDFGVTWTPPVSVISDMRWSDFPSIALSEDGRDVYVAFQRTNSYVVASHDFGATFSAPVKTNSDRRHWWHGGGAVAPNGDVYFGASTQRRRSSRGSVKMFALKSSDGGASWQTLRLDVSSEVPACDWAEGCYHGFLVGVPSVAVDVAGAVLAVYNAGRADGAPQRIWARRSLDGGGTWTRPRRLSKRWPAAHNSFTDVEAGPVAGDFRAVWQGSSRGRVDAWNTYYRRTSDAGVTWEPTRRLSDLGAGAPYKSPSGYLFPYGDYLAIAVDGQGVSHVIWGEGASWNGPGGTWYTRGR